MDDGFVRLVGAEAHHAAKSLRVRVGEEITVADGTGRVVRAVVSGVGDEVLAEVTGAGRCDARLPAIALYQALTKGEKFDEIVEKAGEIGVRRIVPFVAERSIVRWDERKRVRAQQRWSAIARSAAKQSRSPWIARVDEIRDGATIPDEETTIVLHESATMRLRDALPDEAPQTIAIVVGPEGGLADEEIARLSPGGAGIASLGPQVLRTETAGLVAAALIGYRYGTVG